MSEQVVTARPDAESRNSTNDGSKGMTAAECGLKVEGREYEVGNPAREWFITGEGAERPGDRADDGERRAGPWTWLRSKGRRGSAPPVATGVMRFERGYMLLQRAGAGTGAEGQRGGRVLRVV